MLLWVCGSCMWILKEFTRQIVWHFLACRPEMISFGWLKTYMLLDRVVDILWYGGFLKWWYPTTMGFPTKMISTWGVLGVPPFKETPISILTVLFPGFEDSLHLKLTFSGRSSRLKVTFERLKKTTEVWRDFTVDSYLNEKLFGCQASHEEEHIFYDVLWQLQSSDHFGSTWSQKKLSASHPVKLFWNSSLVGVNRKWTKACWWETIPGVALKSRKAWNFLKFKRLFGFKFISIMLFFYLVRTWNWTHLYILLAALIGYTCYTGDHDVVICSWGHGICYQEGLRSQDRR